MEITRGKKKHMGKEMRMRGWKRKYQEDEEESKKKRILRIMFFCDPNSAQNKMYVG